MSLNLLIIVILIGGFIFSRLFKLVSLPQVLGMLIFGIILSFFFKNHIPISLSTIEQPFKTIALTIILLRAGLGISTAILKKNGLTALLLSFVPCIFEGAFLTICLVHLFKFSLSAAGMTGFMLAAVSPAVVIPSMLNLIDGGYGSKKGVPTVVLAGSSADDVFAITIFSAFLQYYLNKSLNTVEFALKIPASIIIGVIPGILVGFLLVYLLNHKKISTKPTEKFFIILAVSLLLVQVGTLLESAALLGVMAVGFILLMKSEDIAHDVSRKLAGAWLFAEIILFVLLGVSVDINVALSAGLKVIALISGGLVFRSLGVIVATLFSGWSLKEKLFCIISYIPKATVQAALGAIPLANGVQEGQMILAISVVSIIFTAPLGLLLIQGFGKKLLSDEK